MTSWCLATEEEHFEHLKQVMLVLEREQLYDSLKKCPFFTLEVIFLGYIIWLGEYN